MKSFIATFGLIVCLSTCMPPATNAQDAPMEIKKYFFVDLIPNPDKPELPKAAVDSIQAAHMQNIRKMAKDGVLMLAGPFEGGGGIFILKLDNIEEATQLANNDPAVQAGRLKIRVRPWYTGAGVFTAEQNK